MAKTQIHLFVNSPYQRTIEVDREEDVLTVIQALKELTVKTWLVSQGRYMDAVNYTPEIEQVAMQDMGFTITPHEETE